MAGGVKEVMAFKINNLGPRPESFALGPIRAGPFAQRGNRSVIFNYSCLFVISELRINEPPRPSGPANAVV
jgi:hypothetical protein